MILHSLYIIMKVYIGERDEFRSGWGGGVKSLARIFSPLLARKSSGFARILLAFWPENDYLKNYRGATAPSLMHRAPMKVNDQDMITMSVWFLIILIAYIPT